MQSPLDSCSSRIAGLAGVRQPVQRVLATLAIAAGLIVPLAGHPAPVSARSVSFATAELAPADSVAYVVMTLDERSEQWRLADTLLDRAGLGPALDQAIADGMNDANGDPLPLDAFLGGEVAIVAAPVAIESAVSESMGTGDMDAMLAELGLATPEAASSEPEPQGFAVILDARAPDTAWTAIRESMEDDGAQELTYEGSAILYAPGAEGEDGTAAARVDDSILIAMTPADLYPILDTADGRSAALSTVPEFTTAQGALPGEYLMFGFLSGQAIAGSDLGPLESATGQIETESYTAMTVAADEPGFRLETVALPVAGGTLPDPTPNYDSSLVMTAPADALAFMSAANLGATGTLDALGAVALSFAFGSGPTLAGSDQDLSPEDAIAAQYESAAQMIGVNLQTELFQQLVGEYGFWIRSRASEGGSPDAVSGLFASDVADPDAVNAALTQLSLLMQGASGGESAITTRDVGGSQLFVIELGDEAGSTLEFGVIDDRLVIGDGRAVGQMDGGGAESLAESAQFQAVMDALPAEHNGMIYVDLAQLIPLVETAESGSSGFGFEESGNVSDASESCAAYATPEEAQAAYDAAEPNTFDLDQDFDGTVCEDFFATGTPETAGSEASDPFADVDYSAVKAFASVSYRGDDELPRSSAILYITD